MHARAPTVASLADVTGWHEGAADGIVRVPVEVETGQTSEEAERGQDLLREGGVHRGADATWRRRRRKREVNYN